MDGFTNQLAFLRVPKNESVWKEVKVDPSADATAGNYELMFSVRIAVKFGGLVVQSGWTAFHRTALSKLSSHYRRLETF